VASTTALEPADKGCVKTSRLDHYSRSLLTITTHDHYSRSPRMITGQETKAQGDDRLDLVVIDEHKFFLSSLKPVLLDRKSQCGFVSEAA